MNRIIAPYRFYACYNSYLNNNRSIIKKYERNILCFASTCEGLNNITVSNLSSEEFSSSKSSDENLKSCDSFGNLIQPLEKSSKRSSRKVRIVKIKSRPSFRKVDESNVFGKLSEKDPLWYPDILQEPKIDNDQSDDSEFVKNISRSFRDPRVYLKKMKDLVREKKLKEALDLFVEMKRNHVVPIPPHFTFMIGACGKVGYTDMAFKLLRQMTDRGIQPTPVTLTGVFNSCGESPIREYGLKKARSLKEKIETKGWIMTQITYHAMIKAFGRCGDIQTAFQIVDEMAAADIEIDVQTYSFLLMSCVENKESGFTHAIEVLRKMKERKCLPNEFTYNLLLRAARDCGIGPEEVSCLLLQHWSNYLKRPYGFKSKEIIAKEKTILELEEISEKGKNFENSEINVQEKLNESSGLNDCLESNDELKNSSLTKFDTLNKDLMIPETVPSVLGQRPEKGLAALDIQSIKSSCDRLALIGGAQGLLKEMEKDKVKPTIKTFTLLLESLPPNYELEEELISLLEVYKVVPDIGFCNILLKRRYFRKEDYSAKEALLLINQWGLTPDIITFGVLALGCRNYNKAIKFLSDLEKLGFCPNVEIAGTLVSKACVIFDFKYLQHILNMMQEQDILPNEKILIRINKTLDIAKKCLIDQEHGKINWLSKRENFSKLYKEFNEFYEAWLHNMEFENEKNVWSQYKTDIIEKNQDEPCKIFPLRVN